MRKQSRKSERIDFKGIAFYRYPDSKQYPHRNYYQAHQAGRKRGYSSLHVAIWEDHYRQKVPEGFHVHHRDGNPLNNDISNLELLSPTEHAKHHGSNISPARRANILKSLEKARIAASEWHGSPEGLEFHRYIGRLAWENKELQSFDCGNCGNAFESYMSWAKFCSPQCGAEFRERGCPRIIQACLNCGKESVLIRVDRTFCRASCRKEHDIRQRTLTKDCPQCGETFTTLRPNKVVCSERCQRRYRYTRARRLQPDR